MIISKTIQLLGTIAEDIEPVSNARLAAAILYRNRIISIGFNQNKSHPFAAEYSKHPEAIFLHAETDAILKAKRRLSDRELKKATLIVVRVKSDVEGNKKFGVAKPCSGCSQCIKEHSLKRVIYTVESYLDSISYVTTELEN